MVDSEVFSVPVSGKVVTVVDQALSGIEGDISSANEVLGSEKLFFLEGHSRVVGVDWDLRKLASSKK